MGGKKDKNKSKASLSKEDAALWRAMTRDVRRLPGNNYEEADDTKGEKDVSPREKITERAGIKTRAAPPAPKGKEVDRRTAQKLARGQMVIEATLDLHGMSQEEAYGALSRFITSNYARGRRCVLIITGKGRQEGQGILRARVPEWLGEETLGPLVLRTAQARPGDGGQGAIYVLLRRQRG
ncbi:MAG: Smr/MutS family protein [Alphaproteobacteria bacterium]